MVVELVVFDLPRGTISTKVNWSEHGFYSPSTWLQECLAGIITRLVGNKVKDRNTDIKVDGRFEFYGKPSSVGFVHHRPNVSAGERGLPRIKADGYERNVFGARLENMSACKGCNKDCVEECEELVVRAIYEFDAQHR